MMELLHDAHVWVLISFVLFACMAFRPGRTALLGKLDGRIEVIRREIETAESLRAEAQELLEQCQHRQRNAAQEAEKIVENARRHADSIKKQAETDIEETIRRKEKQLQDRLESMKETAFRDIRSYAAQLAVNAAAGIIAERMDESAHERLTKQAIGGIGRR